MPVDSLGELIRSAFGSDAVVVARAPLGTRNIGGYYTEEHPHLQRCTLRGGSATPRTVIVKMRRANGDSRADTRFLRNERAALEFLNGIGSTAAPRFIAGDDAAGIVVMEDLGPGLSPDLLLVGADPDAACAGLVAFARGLGRLHASTVGRSEEFYRIRSKLGPVDPMAHRVTYGGAPIIDTWNELKGEVRALLVSPDPAAADGDVDAVIHTLADPGDHLALSNGDVCPQNARLFGDTVRFLDFDGAVFRHALLDAAYLRFPFVDCPCRSLLPDTVQRFVEQAYREELATACLAALDNTSYERGIAAACAAKTIQRAMGFASIIGSDTTYGMRMSVSKRAWLLAAIDTFRAASNRSGTLRTLAEWFGDFADVLTRRWGAEPPAAPLYPAFQRHPDQAHSA